MREKIIGFTFCFIPLWVFYGHVSVFLSIEFINKVERSNKAAGFGEAVFFKTWSSGQKGNRASQTSGSHESLQSQVQRSRY